MTDVIRLRCEELGLNIQDLSKNLKIDIQDIDEGIEVSSQMKILDALGLNQQGRVIESAETIRHIQAKKKAQKIVSMVKGTNDLEEHYLSEEFYAQLEEESIQKFLSGDLKEKLWK